MIIQQQIILHDRFILVLDSFLSVSAIFCDMLNVNWQSIEELVIDGSIDSMHHSERVCVRKTDS